MSGYIISPANCHICAGSISVIQKVNFHDCRLAGIQNLIRSNIKKQDDTKVMEVTKNSNTLARPKSGPVTAKRKVAAKRKYTKLTVDQKKKLISLVKERPEIWSLRDPRHRRPDAQAVAWEAVGKEIELEVAVCKKAWKSLKDCLSKKQKKIPGKSGDSADEGSDPDADDVTSETQIESEVDSWHLWSDLKFIDDEKSGRKTISTEISKVQGLQPFIESEEAILNEVVNSTALSQQETTPKLSNYGYMARKRKQEDNNADSILNGINELVKIRKAESLQTDSLKEDEFKYRSMYLNLDRMLKKLPDSAVENLNLRFVNMAYDELKKHENNYTFVLNSE